MRRGGLLVGLWAILVAAVEGEHACKYEDIVPWATGECCTVPTSCTMIDLSYKGIGRRGVKRLVEALLGNPSVRVLRLHSNKIGDDGAAQIAELVRASPALEAVSLAYNEISSVGIELIARALENNPHVQQLSLAGNPVGPAGAQALATAVATPLSGLRTLHLDRCRIGTPGAVLLAQGATASNSSALRVLDLGRNNIGDMGVQAVLGVRQLQELSLQSNAITEIGAGYIAAALERGHSVRLLALAGNSFGAAGTDAIVRVLQTNPMITRLDLDDDIGPGEKRTIKAALNRNMRHCLQTSEMGTCGGHLPSTLSGGKGLLEECSNWLA